MAFAEVLTPATMDELVSALNKATPESSLLAGGTDLIRAMHQQHWEPELLIDLSGVGELDFVRLDDEHLRVGATTTFARLEADPLVRRHARCLGQAAAQVGSAQIRNVATVGGNIANASACADSVTALVALEAAVGTVDGSGRRTERYVADLFVRAGTTRLAPDEAIVEIVVPALRDGRRSAFAKIGSRSTVSVARLSMALIVTLNEKAGTVSDVRVGLGAIGESAFRDTSVEELLEGRRADAESARLLAEACGDAVRRAIPARPSLPYKQHAVVGLAYDAWNGLGICAPCQPEQL